MKTDIQIKMALLAGARLVKFGTQILLTKRTDLTEEITNVGDTSQVSKDDSVANYLEDLNAVFALIRQQPEDVQNKVEVEMMCTPGNIFQFSAEDVSRIFLRILGSIPTPKEEVEEPVLEDDIKVELEPTDTDSIVVETESTNQDGTLPPDV